MDGRQTVIARDVDANDLAISARGDIYFTDPLHERVWLMDARGRRLAYTGVQTPSCVRLSAGQAFLLVDDSAHRGIWWFQVQPDGSLADGDSLYRLEVADESSATGAGGMAMDTDGFLYVATKLGIQVFDPPGRVMAIIEPPQPGGVSSIVFGGPSHDILYATVGDKVFQRSMRHRGAVSWGVAQRPDP